MANAQFTNWLTLHKELPDKDLGNFRIDERTTLEKAKHRHASYLQHNLRACDNRELKIHKTTAFTALHSVIPCPMSQTFTALVDNKPMCMFGVVPDGFHIASIWLLGTDVINEKNRVFLRYSKYFLEYFLNKYDVLENIVPVDHDVTIRWLKWCRFKFTDKILHNGYECYRFVRCNKNIKLVME